MKTPTRAVETFWRFTNKIAYVFLLLVKTPTRAVDGNLVGENTNKGGVSRCGATPLQWCDVDVNLVGDNTNKGCEIKSVFVYEARYIIILQSCHPVPKKSYTVQSCNSFAQEWIERWKIAVIEAGCHAARKARRTMMKAMGLGFKKWFIALWVRGITKQIPPQVLARRGGWSARLVLIRWAQSLLNSCVGFCVSD